MKIWEHRQQGNFSYIERFELNGVLVGNDSVRPGFLICYLLATNENTTFFRLAAEAEGDAGDDRARANFNQKTFIKEFSTMEQFMRYFTERGMKTWDLDLFYQETQLSVSGQAWSTVIGVSYPLETPINVIPLLSEIEGKTFEYHSFDPVLVKNMKQLFQLNQKQTICSLLKLSEYENIYSEFIDGMAADGFVFPQGEMIVIQGYTAKKLHEDFPLSPLGAYNYLIYLSEDPEDAIADLKRGLPRK